MRVLIVVAVVADHRVAIHTGKLGILEGKALNTSSMAIFSTTVKNAPLRMLIVDPSRGYKTSHGE